MRSKLEPFGELAGALDRVAVVGEALEHLVGREQDRLVVAAPLALAAVERRALADRDEHVLQLRVGAAWCACASPVATVCTPSVSARSRSAAFRRTSPRSYGRWSSTKKRSRPNARASRRRGVRVAHGEPVPRAAGEADEPVVQLEEALLEQRGIERRVLGPGPRPRVRRGQQPAEVRVAARVLDEQRDVRAALERHLRAGDRPDAERLRRVRELERAVDPVVVGERERLVAELGRAKRQLLRQRRTVEEGVRRMRVELDVRHRRDVASDRISPGVSCVEGELRSPTKRSTLGLLVAIMATLLGGRDRARLRRRRLGLRPRWLNHPPRSSSRNTTTFWPDSSTSSK